MLTTIASPADDDTVVRFTSCEALLHQCPQRLLFPRIPDLDTATTSMSLLALTGDAWSRRRCSFSFLCEPPPLGLPLLELQLDMTHTPRATTVSDGFHPLTSMCYDWTGGSTNECDRMVMIIGRIGVSVECGGKVVIIGEIGLRQLNGE
ncbi:hypothetical protein DEO72_LG11g1824 [Vigna unguiculata]|uniref:Uncharacterized protein n=1 Tax=Vigna unguiculata TaxID=3917 RepID=A0A4D6NNA0_VIGUN|nr:hypothetical protein DEO72_LG11g1824 [Vigna unguiculata]